MFGSRRTDRTGEEPIAVNKKKVTRGLETGRANTFLGSRSAYILNRRHEKKRKVGAIPENDIEGEKGPKIIGLADSARNIPYSI